MLTLAEVLVAAQAPPAEAAARLPAMWDPKAPPLPRAVLAQAIAEHAASSELALRWHLEALTAAVEAGDEDAPSAAPLFPAIHAALAADYQALGQLPWARMHVRAGVASLDALAPERAAPLREVLRQLSEALEA